MHTLNDEKNNLKFYLIILKEKSQFLKIKLNNSIKGYKFKFNWKNTIKKCFMAIIAAKYSGISLDKILNTIPKLKPVEGRFEKIGKIKNNLKYS